MLWPGDQWSWAGGQCWILTIDHWHTLDTWCVVMVCSHEMLSVLDQTSCDGVWSDTLTAETVFTSSAQFYHDYQHSSHQPWPAPTSLDQQSWGFLRKSKWFEELDHFFWWLSLVKFVEELWDCLNECSVTDTDTTPIPGPGQYHSGDVEESCNTLLIITDSLKPAQHAATSSFTYFNIQIVSSLLHSLNDSLAFKFDQLRCSARTMQKNASFIIHCLIFSAMFYIHIIYYNLYLIETFCIKNVFCFAFTALKCTGHCLQIILVLLSSKFLTCCVIMTLFIMLMRVWWRGPPCDSVVQCWTQSQSQLWRHDTITVHQHLNVSSADCNLLLWSPSWYWQQDKHIKPKLCP